MSNKITKHGSWIKWLEDSRVGFSVQMANKYVRIARELGQIETSGFNLDVISLNKLYSLASAPDEIKGVVKHDAFKLNVIKIIWRDVR